MSIRLPRAICEYADSRGLRLEQARDFTFTLARARLHNWTAGCFGLALIDCLKNADKQTPEVHSFLDELSTGGPHKGAQVRGRCAEVSVTGTLYEKRKICRQDRGRALDESVNRTSQSGSKTMNLKLKVVPILLGIMGGGSAFACRSIRTNIRAGKQRRSPARSLTSPASRQFRSKAHEVCRGLCVRWESFGDLRRGDEDFVSTRLLGSQESEREVDGLH